MALNIAMSSPYLTTQQVAEMLSTNASVIRASRVSGLLYGKPAPMFKLLGKKKILYCEEEIHKYMGCVEDRRITEHKETS